MSEHSHFDHATLDEALRDLRRAVTELGPPARTDAAIARAIAGRSRRHWHRRLAAGVAFALAATLAAVMVVHPGFAPWRSNPGDRDASNNTAEARTEAGAAAFVPLVSLAELERTHDTLVVAMDMPRTSLAEFGVAVDPARATDTVPTQLLIRPDGAVLAIRFAR